MYPVLLLPTQSPQDLLPHPSAEMTAYLLAFAALLVVSLALYLYSALKSRGKAPVERRGHGNFGGLAGYSGRGSGEGGPPNSAPGFFALYGRSSPYGPYGDAPQKEDPHRR